MLSRFTEISNWLAELFPTSKIESPTYIESDASARKYLRCIINNESYIIMDTAPGDEIANFVNIAKLLDSNQINAPKIIHSNLANGLLLMNDFGTQTYLNVLKNSNFEKVQQLYLDAIYALVKIQKININSNLPIMDKAYIINRLDVFKTWYLQKHLAIDVDADVELLIADLCKIFVQAFNELPSTLVHVDYHSRNLMYLEDATNPGILDFQDAMFGPPTYDLVSLFQDAYITWPRAQVEEWVRTYYDLATASGIIPLQDFNKVLRNFDMVGLQRHIKNLGVFARLHHRDNKSNYLHDIPTLLRYITEACNRYSELKDLGIYLKTRVLEQVV